MTLLTQRAVVMAKQQASYGAAATLSTATDGLLVNEPNFTLDPNILERNFASMDQSPFEHAVGRKLASISFTHEIRGNGIQKSGILTDAPRLARLFQGCGYGLTAMPGTSVATNVGPVTPDGANSPSAPVVTWATGGTALGAGITQPVLYTVTIGATNAYTVTSNNPSIDPVASGGTGTLTTGTAVSLGASGATITPTFSGSIPSGTVYRVLVLPKGLKLAPIDPANQLPMTLEAYFDGLKHKIVDAFGTFSINAEAGNYATAEFTFTGSYVPVVDAALPSVTYETTIPQQVELANLTWGGNRSLVVNAFTFDQQNTVTPRPDVNSADGYKGVRITTRAPSGGMDPEAELEATNPFWADLANASAKHFLMQVGTTPGNITVFHGPRVQSSSLGYGDRNGLRTYDAGLLFKRLAGNDEAMFYLC